MGGQSKKQAIERSKRDLAIERAYTAYIQDFLKSIDDKLTENGIKADNECTPFFSPVEQVEGVADTSKCDFAIEGFKEENRVTVAGYVECKVNKTEEVGIAPYSFNVIIEKVEEVKETV